MAKAETIPLHLQLTCMHPPDTTHIAGMTIFGLQDRQQNVHPGQHNGDGSLLYELDVLAMRILETDSVRFQGLYVHGTPVVPFLYLSLRRLDGDPSSWIRRLKIPLPTVSWIEIFTANEIPIFSARISGQGSGTVPLLDNGWIKHEQNALF